MKLQCLGVPITHLTLVILSVLFLTCGSFSYYRYDKKENGATIMLTAKKGEACPTSLLNCFPYAFCMVVSSIVLMIDGDGRHGGGSQLICPGLFSHLSFPELRKLNANRATCALGTSQEFHGQRRTLDIGS